MKLVAWFGLFGAVTASGSCTQQVGQNNHGTNLKLIKRVKNSDKCCDECAKTENCVGFTWVKSNHECWVKDSLDDLVADNDVVSGSYLPPAPTPPIPVPAPIPPTPSPPVPPPPTPTPSPYPKGCGRDDATDPKYTEQTPTIGWLELDLDLPPQERWANIIKPFVPQLHDLVKTVKAMASVVSEALFELLELLEKQNADVLLSAMPYPYGDEIKGMSKASGLTELDSLICNLIYEITGACTAVIAQDKDGHIFHGHNLDTAASWNFTTGQWELAEKLRQITTNIRFMRGGKNVYNATTYAGYAGIFEGMKAGAFSISVNTRFDSSLYASLRKWISGADRTGQFGTFNVRDALDKDATYDEAVQRLDKTKLMGPGYFTIAGVQPGEGAIMTRNSAKSMRFWTLKDELKKGKNYMVQTNYKHWTTDPFFDKRRVPCQHCMDGVIDGEFGFEQIWQVLSAKPSRNKMTCHTAMFSAREGKIESYQQYCFEKGCKLFETVV